MDVAANHLITPHPSLLHVSTNTRESARHLKDFWKTLMAVISSAFLTTGLSSAAESPHADSAHGSLAKLKNLQADVQSITGKCADATVSIIANANGKSAAGSGVVVSEDGLILTAAHVLDGLGDMATVFFPNGRSVPAKLLGSDFDRDAAMLQITKEGSYPFVELSDRPELAANVWCVAMGHPGGFDPERSPVLRIGHVLVSGDFILTDCTVVGGDSGGPLFDTEGKLVGIHSSIGFGLNENRHVPISLFRDSWDKLKAGERYGSRYSSEMKTKESETPAVFGKVDAQGKDDLDRYLDETLKSENGQQGELRLTPEVLKQFGGMETIMRRIGARSANKALPEEKNPQAKSGSSTAEAPKDGKNKATGMELLDLINKSRENGTELEVTPELLEKMGGMQGLMTQLKGLGITGDGTQPSGTRLPDELRIRDPFMESILGLMKNITEPISQSVGMVSAEGKPLSLATVVDANGYLVAPDLDPKATDLTVQLGERSLVAKIAKQYPQHGLTLLKVEAMGLKPVNLATTNSMAEVGTLVTTPSPDGQALGFGVVGVKERNTIDTPFLGVGKGDAEDGVKVKAVAPRSPADTAGVRIGDVIRSISGHAVRKDTLWDVLKQFSGGDTVDMEIQRDGKILTLNAKLAPSLFRMQADRLRVMNAMSGPISNRNTGFVRVLQHDLALNPQQCGGPLLDLDGSCIAINASRAGRVETLAVPSAMVLDLIKNDIVSVTVSAPVINPAVADGKGWTNDFEAAKKQAVLEQKSLLINFTGSDWCSWCKRLHKEVFDHDHFKEGVKDKFILVELDFPRDKSKIPAELQALNEKIRDAYGIQSFPTVLLTDEKGTPFAKTGYREGGAEPYITNLNELLKIRTARDEAFAKAAAAKGVEKAKILIETLDSMKLTESWIANFYGEIVSQIKAADPEDTCGFIKRADTKEKFTKAMTEISGLIQKRDNEAALALIDKTLESGDFKGDMEQQISFHKGIVLAQMMKFDEAYAAFDACKELNPTSPLVARIDRMKVNLEQMQIRLEEAKKAKEKAKGDM